MTGDGSNIVQHGPRSNFGPIEEYFNRKENSLLDSRPGAQYDARDYVTIEEWEGLGIISKQADIAGSGQTALDKKELS